MRVHRGYLFWGIVFVLLGGLPLAARQGWFDPERYGDLWRLWPVVVVAIGIAIIVGRTRASIVGTIIAGLIVGTLGGMFLARGAGWVFEFGDCAPGSPAEMQAVSENGTFSGPATAELVLSCGSLDVGLVDTTGWSLSARYRGDPPVIASDPTRLAVRNADGNARRQEWRVSLPRSTASTLDVTVNAAQARLRPTDAALAALDLTANASDVLVDASGTSIVRLAATVNAAQLRITLGGATSGTFQVNAGSVKLCVPSDAALTIRSEGGFALSTNFDARGLTRDDDTWTRSGSGPSIQLDVHGTAASVELDPDGGCR
jgi:hypothetical protein